ncbi:MAG: hypothetical protein ABR956_15345 [Terracidiphilus sp.]|jgi:hypothetical protein
MDRETIIFCFCALQGAAAAIYLAKEAALWIRARRGGDMKPLIVHHPFWLVGLIGGCLLTAALGFWFVFHPPGAQVFDVPHTIAPSPVAPPKNPEVVRPPVQKTIPTKKRPLNAGPPGNTTSVEVGAGGSFSQSTTGPCSPAIIGSGNTTNCGEPPKLDRHIPEARKQEILDLLRQKPSKIQICALMGSRESFGFAQDWYQLFEQAGWEIQEKRIAPFMPTIPWAGVQIAYSDRRPAINSIPIALPIPSDEIQVLVVNTALKRLEVKDVTGDPDPAQSRDLVILRIGDTP